MPRAGSCTAVTPDVPSCHGDPQTSRVSPLGRHLPMVGALLLRLSCAAAASRADGRCGADAGRQ